MNTQDIVEIIDVLEQKESKTAEYLALEKLGCYDEREEELFSRTTGEPYNHTMIPRNVYSQEEIALLNSWASDLEEDNLANTPFAERTFLRNFLSSIPIERQSKYILNTNMYYGNHKELADRNYVLVTRRTLPSIDSKPEAFWSEDPTTPLWGLRHEIRDEQRAYSVIIVSTLGMLSEHGSQDFELLSGGVSDGEIITSSKPFPKDKILFAFKPLDEIPNLRDVIRNNSTTYHETLNKVTSLMQNRYANANTKPHESNNSSLDDNFEFGDWD